MKDSLSPPFVPSLSLPPPSSPRYIQTQTVNANKAFSHTELMYPVHYLLFIYLFSKCHLLCRRLIALIFFFTARSVSARVHVEMSTSGSVLFGPRDS